jgi:hypothetical protein
VLAENYALLEESILDLPLVFYERVVRSPRLCLPSENVLFDSLFKYFELRVREPALVLRPVTAPPAPR